MSEGITIKNGIEIPAFETAILNVLTSKRLAKYYARSILENNDPQDALLHLDKLSRHIFEALDFDPKPSENRLQARTELVGPGGFLPKIIEQLSGFKPYGGVPVDENINAALKGLGMPYRARKGRSELLLPGRYPSLEAFILSCRHDVDYPAGMLDAYRKYIPVFKAPDNLPFEEFNRILHTIHKAKEKIQKHIGDITLSLQDVNTGLTKQVNLGHQTYDVAACAKVGERPVLVFEIRLKGLSRGTIYEAQPKQVTLVSQFVNPNF